MFCEASGFSEIWFSSFRNPLQFRADMRWAPTSCFLYGSKFFGVVNLVKKKAAGIFLASKSPRSSPKNFR